MINNRLHHKHQHSDKVPCSVLCLASKAVLCLAPKAVLCYMCGVADKTDAVTHAQVRLSGMLCNAVADDFASLGDSGVCRQWALSITKDTC